MRGFIRMDRARQAARLVREVAEIGACTEAARRHVKETLLRLVGAVIGGSVDDLGRAMRSPHRRPDVLTVDTPYHAAVLASSDLKGEPLTVTNVDIVPARRWRESSWVNELVRPAGLDHFLGSHWRFGDGAIEGMGFMRAAGDAPFDDEDRALLHLVHLGIGRMFEPTFAHRQKLSPRARDTLDAMLTGATDKEIAAELGISVHTVRDYVKSIFRAFGVSSRAQVLAAAAGRSPQR